MSGKFSNNVADFLGTKFGSLLAKQYMDMGRYKLNIKSLDTASEYEQIMFLDFISDKMLGSKYSTDVKKRKKSIIYYKILGSNMKLPFQPVCFLDYNFGANFGEKILNASQSAFSINDITSYDEQYQATFIKSIMNDMFNFFGDEKISFINDEFEKFMKFEDHISLDIFKSLMPPSGYDIHSSIEVCDSINDYMNIRSNNTFSGFLDSDLKVFLEKMGVESSEFSRYISGIQNAIQKKKIVDPVSSGGETLHTSYMNDLCKVLEEYVGPGEADFLLKQCFSDLEIRDLTLEAENKKVLFLEYLLSNTYLSNFSEQKKNLIRDKVRNIILT